VLLFSRRVQSARIVSWQPILLKLQLQIEATALLTDARLRGCRFCTFINLETKALATVAGTRSSRKQFRVLFVRACFHAVRVNAEVFLYQGDVSFGSNSGH
jgi:hypothetical protein